ncbi:FG-GAP-like repeat-containing protein [Niabella sp.]|uniref:FG-GAP-like repeat-containing protein n=1 Tax=Niabella sp. TaxID=1962976 RepID=UPI0026153375|nr:FG-GAP-like repeat-containing protein [Niabella sp.]
MKRVLLSSVLALLTASVLAQINPSKPVGVLEGNADVSLDGAASYSVPIKVPKGIAGMQPSLSISYNSRTTDGLAGWGWNLTGLSGITRGGQTRYHNGLTIPVRFNADDNFYLDGQLLIPVSGTNGSNGTVYETEAKNYSKIESFGTVAGDPDWWRVTSKEGVVMEYGAQTSDRLRATANFSWFISNTKDVSNNTITYNYSQYENGTWLDNIAYSNVTLQFGYFYKQNTSIAFVGGMPFKGFNILNKITINIDGVRQIDYKLNQEVKLKRHYLKSIELVGTDNMSSVLTKFDYGKVDEEEGTSFTLGSYNSLNSINATLVPGDFDGDGRTDLLIADKQARFNTAGTAIDSITSQRYDIVTDILPGGGVSAQLKLSQNLPAASYVKQNDLTSPYSSYPTDFNGNGKDGILRATNKYHIFWNTKGGQEEDGMSYTDYLKLDNFTSNGSGGLSVDSTALPIPNSLGDNYNFYLKDANSLVQGDFDGDGKGDAIMILGRQYQTGTGSKQWSWVFPTGWTYAYYPIFDYSYKAFFTNTSNGYYNSEILGLGNEVKDAKAIYAIDFDGDGKQELIVFKPYSYIVYAINQIPASSGYNFQATQILNAVNISYNNYRQVMIGDFNGDKKTDIVCISNNTSYASVFYSSGTDYKYAPFYLQYTPSFDYRLTQSPTSIARPARFAAADLNGDGLTDIYQSDTYTATFSYPGPGTTTTTTPNDATICKNGTCTYYYMQQRQAVYYSKGLDSYEMYEPMQTAYVCESNWNNFLDQHPDAEIVETDFGGCWNPYTHQDEYTYYVTYDYQPVTTYTYIYTTPTGTNYNLDNTPYFPLSIGDFDGDGKMELIQGDATNYGLINGTKGIGANKDVSLLNKVTDGFGNETTFTYESLAEKNSGPIYTTTGALSNAYPINVMSLPIKVVKNQQSPDGIGGTVTRNYRYEDLVLDRQKGLLGFAKMTTSSTLGDKTESTSELSGYYRVLLPKTSNMYLNDTLISTSVQTSTIVPLSTTSTRYYTSFNRIKVQSATSIERNLVSGAAVKREMSYDSYDNVTQQVTKSGYWDGSDVTALETATVSTQYTQTGKALVPVFPIQVTASNTKGTNTASKIGTMSYTTDRGLLQNKTDWASTPLAASTTYSYDIYGNMIQSVSSIPSKPNLTTTYTYDVAQKFVVNTVASCDGITSTGSVTYHPLWAVPLTSTDGDGTSGSLTTIYEYDALGKLMKTTTPLGHQIFESDVWDVNGQQTYYHLVDYPDGVKSDQKVWYDRLGRGIKTQVLGWNGQWTTQTKNYDAKGRISSESAPYYTGETILTTTSIYGAPLNQLSATITPNGTATISYSYPGYGQSVITRTNLAGQVSSEKRDAIGLSIETLDHGGVVTYAYDERRNPLTTVVNGTTMVTNTYDSYGRKILANEANAGTIGYEYDASGLLTKQTDANGKITNLTYDGLGRALTRTTVDGTTTFEYYNAANNKALKKISNGDHSRETFYDNYQRVVQQQDIITGEGTFNTVYEYDANDNLSATIYPDGTRIENQYTNAGILTKVLKGTNVLYEAAGFDGLGHATQYRLVNGLLSTNYYDKGLPTKYYTAGIQDLRFSFDLNTGNLSSRNDALRSLSEVFTYDNLNRLTSATVNGTQQFSITYDGAGTSQSVGNIASKSDIGNYTYMTARPNAVAYVSPMVGTSALVSDPALSVSYSSFQRPLQIVKGINTLDLTYGVDDERVKTVQSIAGSMETKLFLGSYERQSLPGGVVNHIVYVAGGNGLCAMIINGAPHAVYTDYLGSILVVTNSSGTVVAEQNFDAWGRKRNPANWTYASVPSVPVWLFRGYTGHEQLEAFGLINMNARLYDPFTGKMLSPDNYGSGVYGTQGFNRYSYANNNPLMFRDLTGNWAGWDDVIVAGAGFLFGYIKHGITTHDWGLKALGEGALTAATFMLGYYTGGSSVAASGYASIFGQAGANLVAAGYAAGMVATSAASSLFPQMTIPISKNFALSFGPSIAFGSTGASFGLSASGTATFGDFSLTAGLGVGKTLNSVDVKAEGWYNTNTVAVRLGGFGVSSTGINVGDGKNYYNQRVNGITYNSKKGFYFAFYDDYSPIGSSTDKGRTFALEMGYGNFGFGTQIFTTDHSKYEDALGGASSWKSRIWGYNNKRGVYDNNTRSISSPLYFSIKAQNGFSYRFGIESPMVQDFFQNGFHKYLFPTPYFRTDYDTPTRPYGYFGNGPAYWF